MARSAGRHLLLAAAAVAAVLATTAAAGDAPLGGPPEPTPGEAAAAKAGGYAKPDDTAAEKQKARARARIRQGNSEVAAVQMLREYHARHQMNIGELRHGLSHGDGCERRYLVTATMGGCGLGNCLYEYMNGLAIAVALNRTLITKGSSYFAPYFGKPR